MPSSARLAGALDALVAELAETAAWEREIASEARRAAARRDSLVHSLRATIGTLDLLERAPWLARLRAVLGHPEPTPIACTSERTRLALAWLALREPAEFAVAELAAHLRAHGHDTARGYLPALLTRWGRAGAVERLGSGRYRVNVDRIAALPGAG